MSRFKYIWKFEKYRLTLSLHDIKKRAWPGFLQLQQTEILCVSCTRYVDTGLCMVVLLCFSVHTEPIWNFCLNSFEWIIRALSKKSNFHFDHIPNRTHSKKTNTLQKGHIPFWSHCRWAHSKQGTSHSDHIPKKHIPKRTHPILITFQKRRIPFWSHSKKCRSCFDHIPFCSHSEKSTLQNRHITFWSHSKKDTFPKRAHCKRAHSKKNTFQRGHIPKRAHTKKGTLNKRHIPFRSHSKKGTIQKNTFQKEHIPKRVHSKKSTFQKGPIPKRAHSKKGKLHFEHIPKTTTFQQGSFRAVRIIKKN